MGAGKLNPGPSEEQPVLLTAEPSLQPLQQWLLEHLPCVLHPEIKNSLDTVAPHPHHTPVSQTSKAGVIDIEMSAFVT